MSGVGCKITNDRVSGSC